jgi:polyisoprenoid-binding protein YceI
MASKGVKECIFVAHIKSPRNMSKQLWIMDPAHSEVTFKVRHMMITNVSGTFENSTGSMNSDAPDFSDAELQFEAEVASVNTRNSQRDEHLRTNEFFDAASHPSLRFDSGKLEKTGDKNYVLHGDITIRGVKKSISMQVNYTGLVVDPWGLTRAGFEISGSLMRADFGLHWNANTEDGSIVLSDEVKLLIHVQMIKQV